MANTAESLADLFFSKLKVATNAGVVLAQFYGAMLNVEVGRSEIIGLNRLIKIFGRTSVFFAIIDISRKGSPFAEFPYGLLYKICKDKFESSSEAEMSIYAYDNLDRMITEAQKEILRVKKIDPEKASKFLDERKY